MKKTILILFTTIFLTACAGKDIYFNGAEGSHSGLKIDKHSREISINR
ncbi:MAG: hypothetical protein Q4B95_01020 [Lonepinella koalarum]|nr:hypothetical protein [Lonepinella koalarum]